MWCLKGPCCSFRRPGDRSQHLPLREPGSTSAWLRAARPEEITCSTSLHLMKKQSSVESQEPVSIGSLINVTLIYMCAYICILFCVYACIHFLSAIPAASPLGTQRKLGDYNVIFSSTDIMWIAILFG